MALHKGVEEMPQRRDGLVLRGSRTGQRADVLVTGQAGRDAATRRSGATTMQNTLCTCGHRRLDHAVNPDTDEIGGGECLFPVGCEQRMEDGTKIEGSTIP
jgi:hypothetical protein